MLGVPVGNTDQLDFNAHRVYGPVRLPLLIEHYDSLGVVYEDYPNITMENIHTHNPTNDCRFQKWMILKCKT